MYNTLRATGLIKGFCATKLFIILVHGLKLGAAFPFLCLIFVIYFLKLDQFVLVDETPSRDKATGTKDT